MDDVHFSALKEAKMENYKNIYKSEKILSILATVRPMMRQIYETLLSDLENHNTDSFIYRHHIAYVNQAHYRRNTPYENEEPNQIVVDYIASMTDDYFVDLHAKLFPDSKLEIHYKGYFET